MLLYWLCSSPIIFPVNFKGEKARLAEEEVNSDYFEFKEPVGQKTEMPNH